MFKNIKCKKLGLVSIPVFASAANAAALDTTQLSDITASLSTASAWLSGPVTLGIVGLIVAVLVIAIVKFAGKKAKP